MDTNKISNLLNREMSIEYHNTISSTNDYLKSHNNVDLVISKTQSKGRGRYSKSFISYQGGLYFSLKIKTEEHQIEKLTIIAVLSLLKAFWEYGISLEIKWLNDLLLNNLKVSGILCENSYLGSDYEYSIVGIGINLIKPKNDVLVDSATYIFDEFINQEELLVKIINYFFSYLKDDNYLSEYKDKSCLIGKYLKYQGDNYLIRDILSDGRLCVELNNQIYYFDNSTVDVEVIEYVKDSSNK